MIDRLLHFWDNEENEIVVRWRLFKMRWLPYRLVEFKGYDEETLEIEWGETTWHRPDRFRRRASNQDTRGTDG